MSDKNITSSLFKLTPTEKAAKIILRLIDELQLGIPELRTKKHPLDVLEKSRSKSELIKAMIIQETLKEYVSVLIKNPKTTPSIVEFYKSRDKKLMGLFDNITAQNKYALKRGKVMKGKPGNKKPNKSGFAGKNQTLKKKKRNV